MSELNASNLRKERGNEGPDLVGVTELTSPYFMVLPSGNTAERPQNPEKGTLRFNTDIGSLEYFKGDTIGWESINRTTPNLGGGSGSNEGVGARGIYASGYGSNYTNIIDYITISTLGNAEDFGDVATKEYAAAGGSSTSRGIIAGGSTPGNGDIDEIQYLNISSTGNSADFGNLTVGRRGVSGMSNGTRFCAAGGYSEDTTAKVDTIDYITIAATGNAVDFGNLSAIKNNTGATQSTTRGVINCGDGTPAHTNTIEYITIATLGNATDFGDAVAVRGESFGGGNATRGLFLGGVISPTGTNTIEFITIATLGNAIDFGDLSMGGQHTSATSSPTRTVTAGTVTVNTMSYVQIMTTGNGADFGDLTLARWGATGISNAHGGL